MEREKLISFKEKTVIFEADFSIPVLRHFKQKLREFSTITATLRNPIYNILQKRKLFYREGIKSKESGKYVNTSK